MALSRLGIGNTMMVKMKNASSKKRPDKKRPVGKKLSRQRATTRKPAPLPDDNRLPSEVRDDHWIYAYRKNGEYPKHSRTLGGKWLLFIQLLALDAEWQKIRQATVEGKLGDLSKVATARPNPLATNSSAKVICVYTYNWTDEEDVRRIRETLRQLGFTRKIPYKADQETRTGQYAVSATGRVSKYFE